MSYAYAERLLTDDETRQLVEYQREFDKDLAHRAEVLAVRILMRREIRPAYEEDKNVQLQFNCSPLVDLTKYKFTSKWGSSHE